jgi:hypothetical protein
MGLNLYAIDAATQSMIANASAPIAANLLVASVA